MTNNYMTKISIYQEDQFKKHGGLKKNAKAEYQTEVERMDAKQMAEYIKYLGYKDFKTPYIFTHIKAISPYNGQTVRIFQDFKLKDGYIMTSPQELLTYLA